MGVKEDVMKYFIANWKSHKKTAEAVEWLEKFAKEYQFGSEELVVIAGSFVHLEQMAQKVKALKLAQLSLAAQDVSPFPFGAYTGEVSAEMLSEYCQAVIVGHSERRKYFGETSQMVANKVAMARGQGLKPILCVDMPYVKEQLAALEPGSLHDTVLAYEPLEAIGSGRPETVEGVKAAVAAIRQLHEKVPIVYGGSITSANAREYMEIEGISGFLVGGASLDPQGFADLVRNGRSRA